MKPEFVFTSESVTEGHPDKMCDLVSDAIVGRILHQDPSASVIAECAISTGIVFVAAKLGCNASVDIPSTARQVIRLAGYDRDGFDVNACTVMTSLNEATRRERTYIKPDWMTEDQINAVVVRDQATVFGYACDHTPTLMPVPIWLAHKLARRMSAARRADVLPYLAPDAKTQVGVEFRGRRPCRVHSVSILACQMESGNPKAKQLREDLMEYVVMPTLEAGPAKADSSTRFFINPSGPVVLGGPSRHSGMTGRKSSIDTYGEFSRCSASAMSGKDPTRIDRVGAYAARYAAKNVVAAGLAAECEVQLSYCPGLPGPVSVQVETYGTQKMPESEIVDRVVRHIDFRLAGIIQQFHLQQLAVADSRFYERLAVFGQVGRDDLDLPWEKTDKSQVLAN
jgi:S-adenosylmethionine synthetase